MHIHKKENTQLQNQYNTNQKCTNIWPNKKNQYFGKSNQNERENPQTNHNELTKNPRQSLPNLTWKLSWGLFVALGALLAPIETQEPFKNEQPDPGAICLLPPGVPFWEGFGPCWRYVGQICDPKAHGNHILWSTISMLASDRLRIATKSFLEPESIDKSLQHEVPEGLADSQIIGPGALAPFQ